MSNLVIERLRLNIETSKLWAQWWIASAVTGHCKAREIYHGVDGPELTDAEKVEDAMATAKRHIENTRTVTENLCKLLEDEDVATDSPG